jgi:hypothetical protein
MSSMLDNKEERRVKAMHDVTQFYQHRPSKRTVSRQELPRADMTIEDQSSAAREEESSEDDYVEDDTYMPFPRARPHGKGLASASGSGAAMDEEEIVEEEEGNDVLKVIMRRMKKFLMLRRSTTLSTYIWELQFSGYPSTQIGGRKSATRALLKKNLALTIDFTQHFSSTAMRP